MNQAPAITSVENATFTVGDSGSFTVTATGFPVPTIADTGMAHRRDLHRPRHWLGALTGTPVDGEGGVYSITFTTQNSVGNTAQSFTLTVNETPEITSAADTTFTAGAVSSFAVTATGFPAPTVSQSGTLPVGITFNTSTNTLEGIQNTGTRSGLTIRNDVTVATTTGTAVMFNNVSSTAGAAPTFGINFRAVSANGAGYGIVLTNVNNASGSFTITGDGTNNGSGGTIQATAGSGVLLTDARNVSFSSLRILNTAGSGIQGTRVTNFAFVNGLIDGSGSPALTNSANLAFNGTAVGTANNLQGIVTITGNSLLNAAYHGVDILNYAGIIADANVSANMITSATSAAASQGSGIRLISFGSASTVSHVTRACLNNNVITNFPSGAGILVHGGNANLAGPAGTIGLAGSATDIVAITGNRIAGESPATRMNTHAIQAAVNGGGQGNFNISGNGTVANPITNIGGNVISHSSLGDANVTSTIANNVIVANHQANFGGALGLSIGAGSATGFANTANLATTITGNQISQTDGNGTIVSARQGSD